MDSDPDLEIIEKDSGMSSLGGSKDDTPERRAAIEDAAYEQLEPKIENAVQEISSVPDDEENFDDEPDETLAERLWGLTEMFPEGIRNVCELTTNISIKSTKALYKFTCNASWIFFTSSIVLFAPVLFETERAQMIEMEKSQKQRVLLGPGAAISPGGESSIPNLPPMTR